METTKIEKPNVTQKDKDLLLKDLCARLPYGVKIKTSYNKIDEPVELRSVNPINGTFAIGNNSVLINGLNFDTYECKPYLFPLSSMTEKHKEDFYQAFEEGLAKSLMVYEIIVNWCDKNNFDHRGLIEKNLAINATNLNVY